MIERINEEELRKKYFWEFLSRNPNYQADKKSLEAILLKKLKIVEEKFHINRGEKESLIKYIERIFWTAINTEIYEKKLRREPINGESPLEAAIRVLYGVFTYPRSELLKYFIDELYPPTSTFYTKWGISYIFPETPIILTGVTSAPVLKDPYKISLKIDIRKPTKYLLSHLKQHLVYHKNKLLEEKRIKIKRPQWSKYDEYLKIWNLKQEHKTSRTFEQIAKILDPRLKDIKLSSELSRNDNRVRAYTKRIDELKKQGCSDDEAVRKANKKFGIADDKDTQKLVTAIVRVWYGYHQAKRLINEGYKEL